MICKYCENEISKNTNICPNCRMINSEYFKLSFGSKLIALVFPIVGVCMFFIMNSKNKANSRKILSWTIYGFISWIFLYITTFFMGIILAFQI